MGVTPYMHYVRGVSVFPRGIRHHGCSSSHDDLPSLWSQRSGFDQVDFEGYL